MKKRILAMLLVLALLLAGCGSGREDVKGRVEQAEKPTATEAPAETEAVETEAAAEENPLSLGRVEGGTYINEYAGFGCTLDESWVFYSAEELQEMPSLAKEAVSGSELGDALDAMNQFTDVMAENLGELVNFNVLYQKLSMEERLGNAILSEEELIDGVLGIQDQMIAAYAQAGIIVDSMQKVYVTFAGEERVAIHTASTIEGVPYYTLQLFTHNRGSHSVTLTLASYLEDNTTALLDLFYSVD